MAIPFMQMPAYNPGNSLLNFEPIQQALNQKIRKDQADFENQFRMDRAQKEDARYDEQSARLKAEAFGKKALAFSQLPDNQRDPAAWDRLLKEVPGEIPQQYRDPIKGPAMVAAEFGQWRNPLDDEVKRAQLDLTRAQTAKAQREASGSAVDYGKSGAIMQGPDGRFYTVQFGSRGERQILPVEVDGKGLAPAKGVTQVGDELVANSTGQAVRNVAPQIAGAETAKVEGRAQGEGKANFGKMQSAYRTYKVQSDLVLEDVERALQQTQWGTTGWRGALQSYVKGSPAYDLKNTITTIRGNIGLDKLQDMRNNNPTGGALGSVTERELEILTATLGALEQSQSEEQLRFNLTRLGRILRDFREIREEAYQRDVQQFGGNRSATQQGGAGAAGNAPPSGRYVYDPATDNLRPAK